MQSSRDCIKILPKYYFQDKWLLSLYILKYSTIEDISNEVIDDLINRCLTDLESKCISNEFMYFRVGTVFIHFGKRGVNFSIWHIGKWGDTWEYFSCTWYCYGRDILSMELLDSSEPQLSQYEVNILIDTIIKYDVIINNDMSQKQARDFILSELK